MANNQVDLKIGVQYDGAGASAAIEDINKLPKSVRDLGAELNSSAAAADEMRTALSRANAALEEQIAQLDPASAGYAKAMAAAQGYISRQTTLMNRVETARRSIQSQADTLRQLSREYQMGRLSSDAYAEAVDKIGAKSIQAQRACEQLNAQLRAMQATQQSQAMNALRGQAAPGRMATSLRGLLAGVTRGADQGTLSLTSLTGAALRFGTVGAGFAAVKVAMDSVGQAVQKTADHFQTLNDDRLTATSNFFSNILAADADFLGEKLANLAIRAGDALNLKGTGFGDWIAGLGQYASLKQKIERDNAAAAAADEKRRAAERKHWEDALANQLKNAPSDFGSAVQQELAARKEVYEQRKIAAKEEEEAAARSAAIEEQAANRTLAARQRELELAVARGDMTQQAAELELARAQEAHDTRMANLQAESSARKAAAAEAAADLAKAYSEGMVGAMNNPEIAKWQPVLEFKMPDMDRLREIEVQLGSLGEKGNEAAVRALEAERRQIATQAQALASLFTQIDSSLRPSAQEAVKLAESLRETAKNLESSKDEAAKQAAALQRSAQAAQANADLQTQKSEDEVRTAAAAREIAEAQAAAAERAKGWERLEDASLSQQIDYVEDMVDATKKGSDEWEQWSRQLKRLHNQEAQKELARIQRLGQDYGRSEDAGAQRAILRRQRTLLEQLSNRTGLSADLQEQIAQEQAGVRAEMARVKRGVAAQAREGQKKLLENKPPDVQPANAGYKGIVDNYKKQMELQSRELEQAVRTGNMDRARSLFQQMRRNALAVEKLTDYEGSMAKWLEDQGKAAQDLLKGNNGKTLKENQAKQVTDTIKNAGKSSRDRDREDSKATRNRRQTPESTRRDNRAGKKSQQPDSAASKGMESAAQAAQGANQAATQASASAQALATQLTALQSQLQQQATTFQQALSVCTSLASAQASVNSSLKSQLASLQQAVSRLQTRN